MTPTPTRSLRRLYLEWVEEQIEDYKDRVPRSQLLELAEEVCEELRVNRRGQYQITELLLCDEVDRRIFRLLKLPGYRAWRARYRPAPHDPPRLRLIPPSPSASGASLEEERLSEPVIVAV